MQDLKLRANGIDLHVVDYGGRGEPVFCVHGLMANSRCWDGVAELMIDQYRMIAYDLRGRGDSQKPAEGYGIHRHVEDVKGLLDCLGLKRIILMGHSLGANIGVCFAAKYPDYATHLVLVDAGANINPRTLQLLTPLIDSLENVYPDYHSYISQCRTSPFFPTWNRHLDNYYYANVSHHPDGTIRTKTSRQVVLDELKNNKDVSVDECHRKIRVPTLFLQAPLGLLNPELPVLNRQKGQEAAATIPGGRFIQLDGANHYNIIFTEHPRLVREVKSFLETGY